METINSASLPDMHAITSRVELAHTFDRYAFKEGATLYVFSYTICSHGK